MYVEDGKEKEKGGAVWTADTKISHQKKRRRKYGLQFWGKVKGIKDWGWLIVQMVWNIY